VKGFSYDEDSHGKSIWINEQQQQKSCILALKKPLLLFGKKGWILSSIENCKTVVRFYNIPHVGVANYFLKVFEHSHFRLTSSKDLLSMYLPLLLSGARVSL
jgi:hypothetical protein